MYFVSNNLLCLSGESKISILVLSLRFSFLLVFFSTGISSPQMGQTLQLAKITAKQNGHVFIARELSELGFFLLETVQFLSSLGNPKGNFLVISYISPLEEKVFILIFSSA